MQVKSDYPLTLVSVDDMVNELTDAELERKLRDFIISQTKLDNNPDTSDLSPFDLN